MNLPQRSESIWTSLEGRRRHFLSPTYSSSEGHRDQLLIPVVNTKRITLWRGYFLRWNSTSRPAPEEPKSTEQILIDKIRSLESVFARMKASSAAQMGLDEEPSSSCTSENDRDDIAILQACCYGSVFGLSWSSVPSHTKADTEDVLQIEEDKISPLPPEASISRPLHQTTSVESRRASFLTLTEIIPPSVTHASSSSSRDAKDKNTAGKGGKFSGGEERRFVSESRDVLWMPDQLSVRCRNCTTSFGVFVRRHHCRACGQVFCSECTPSRKMPNPTGKIGSKRIRYCHDCWKKVKTSGDLNLQQEKAPDDLGLDENKLQTEPQSLSRAVDMSRTRSTIDKEKLLRIPRQRLFPTEGEEIDSSSSSDEEEEDEEEARWLSSGLTEHSMASIE